MTRVPPAELVAADVPESSAVVATRIAGARTRQAARGVSNGRQGGRRLLAAAGLTADAERVLVVLAELEGLSARGTGRLLRVARTIADLAADERVAAEHLEEAARFRSPARRMADRLASA